MAVASSTAHDTLARKSKDAGVISDGHPVAKALKNEGIRIVDVRHEQVAALAR
jgi:acetolactate synthase-1/2/3 large subunit